MKKFFIILSCVFFINSTLDSENIELDIERLGENSVQISWSINYDEYDRIVLEVLNQNNSERTRYILPSLKGVVELCCFEGDVGATITVTKSKAIDKSDEILANEKITGQESPRNDKAQASEKVDVVEVGTHHRELGSFVGKRDRIKSEYQARESVSMTHL